MTRLRLALPCLALLAACGTTVPMSQQVVTSGLGDGTGVTSQPTQGALPGGGTSGTTGGVVAGTTGTPGSTGSTGSVVTPRGGASQAPGVPSGPTAVSRTPVEIAFFVVKDLGPATKALGVDGLATGDGKRQAQATVGLLNSRGGIAGHPVKPVIFEYDATQSGAPQLQAACSLFFDDHKVRALVSALLLPQLRACAGKAGVPLVSSGNRSTSAAELARYPLTAAPPVIALDRLIPTWVTSLKAQGYFAAGSRVGLIYNEDADFSGVPAMVDKALRSAGSSLVEKQSMPSVDDTSRVGAASSAGSNAALRFASSRVDRVLVVDKSGQALAYFGLAAQNQGYYPVYGISSLELPNALRTVLSARSLQGARGIGWAPGLDLPVRSQPVTSPTFSSCVSAMTKAGEDMSSGSTRFSALATCEATLLLAAAWTDNALSSSTFLPGLRALGTRFAPALTFATDFSKRVDGASRYKALGFDAGCDCFTYRGALQTAL